MMNKFTDPETLAKALGFPIGTLYGVANQISRHYHTVPIDKSDGTKRFLSVPDTLLKSIQHRIHIALLSSLPVSPYAKAYLPHTGILQNALPHVGKNLLLKLDIHDFFGSIHYSAVKDKAFPAELYSEPLRVLLTMLCYKGDSLPQGAPTSPAISNRILYDFDLETGKRCNARGITYTRYCDDMTFSGDFDRNALVCEVTDALAAENLFLNTQKTRSADGNHRQSVTGLIVNHGITVPAAYRRELRQEMYYLRKFGITEHLKQRRSEESAVCFLQRLLGKVNYVLSVMPDNKEVLAYRTVLTEALKNDRRER